MNIVTGFDESFEPPDGKPVDPLLDYIQVLEALEYNIQVAENVFARAAKRTLRTAFPKTKLKKTDEVEVGSPLWISEDSFSFVPGVKNLLAKKDRDIITKDNAKKLVELTENLASHIQNAIKGKVQVIMVDALWTRITEIGEGRYRFSIKQKWTVIYG